MSVSSSPSGAGTIQRPCHTKRNFHILDENDVPIATVKCLNTTCIEADAKDRPTYNIITDVFKIAGTYGQKCTINKKFVEVCDLTPKSKKSRLKKFFSNKE